MRTALEAYKHIEAEYLAGRLGAINNNGNCVYEDDEGKHCAVGCLFSPEQLADIKKLRLLDESILEVAIKIGKNNVEYVTGLPLSELRKLQNIHDAQCRGLSNEVFGSKNTYFYGIVVNRIQGLTKAPK